MTDLNLGPEYRSDENDLVDDFYLPCLSRATLYRRAVGYFTSQGLTAAAQGISALLSAGGQMHLVASPLFNEEDITAIKKGYEAREDAVVRALLVSLEDIESELIRNSLEVLASLVAGDHLEIRVAVPVDEAGAVRHGIYHEKLGLFTDTAQNVVAFTGSPNETSGGLLDNFETIDVFTSWGDQGRVTRKVSNFERLWKDKTPRLSIMPFPEAVRKRLLEFRGPTTQVSPMIPLSKWRHQDEAIECFLKRERGILEMATGTGKTHTALRICDILAARKLISTIVVSADGSDLLEQWHIQLLAALPDLGGRFVVQRHYGSHHERDRFDLSPRFSILVVSRPALAPALRTLTSQEARETLLIHDEVHRLGSPANRASLNGLSDNIRFRLGLSATPEREYDDEGTAFITAHIGPIIFRFELADAITRGVLAPFTYSPLDYDINDEDRSRIQEVYRRFEARKHSASPMTKEELWIELSKVHKTSAAKLPVFEEFLREKPDTLERCIIFVETMDYGEEVLRIVHKYRHDFHTYYSGEEAETLRRFARGEIQCLITCHRLSEGIDIRSIVSVVLFSSSRAPLETIQRIGRCLRIDPESPQKRAHIVDFIRHDPRAVDGDSSNTDTERRDWLSELSQVRPEDT